MNERLQLPIQAEVPGPEYWRRQVACQDACPVHTDARGYVRAIARGDFDQAYRIARGPNPLASICGRVCGAPCEAACRRGRIDEAISIRALKRFVTERFGPESHRQGPIELLRGLLTGSREGDCEAAEELRGLRNLLRGLDGNKSRGHEVAIIGSGPAGLAAAHDLALLGHRPTVFELEPVPAGMLATGIPAYRLPRDLIEAEVALIRALGVKFECGVEVGRDISFAEIRSRFAATLIAVGAKRSRELPLPGADGPGVLGGVEFLRDVSLGKPVPFGKKIVVIGGGNVAYDVSRSVVRQTGLDVSRSALRRQGVTEVHLVSLESLEELPADDIEIVEGDEEGIRRHHRLGPSEVLRDAGGNVTGVRFRRVLSVFDPEGRFSPLFADAETVTLEADTVIWAIGQRPDLQFLALHEGETGGAAGGAESAGGGNGCEEVRLLPNGYVECDRETLATSAPDVFAAGDIAHGPRLLIDAVASGKKAARAIHERLTGVKVRAEELTLHLELPDWEREPDYEKRARVKLPSLAPAERARRSDAVVELPLAPEVARFEASRCLDCGVNTIFDSEKCILCGGCADVCPELCLRLVPAASLAGDKGLDDLLEARFGAGGIEESSAIVKDEARCIRCALCAERCPVDAITMERMTCRSLWKEVMT